MTAANRILLLRPGERTSVKGNTYPNGRLGKASVVAFQAEEPDKFGNPVWQVFVTEPPPRTDQPQQRLPLERPASPAGASAARAGAARRATSAQRPAGRSRVASVPLRVRAPK